MIWKDFTNILTVFEKLQSIFRKDVYFGFLAYYEILTPLNLRALWTVFKVYNFLTLMKSVGIHIQRGYQPYICHTKLKRGENCTNIRTMQILRACAKRDTFYKKCPVLRTRIDILFFNLLQLLMHPRTWEWFLTSLHWSYLQIISIFENTIQRFGHHVIKDFTKIWQKRPIFIFLNCIKNSLLHHQT